MLGRRAPLDFDADAGGIGLGVQLFHLHADHDDARVGEAKLRDLLGRGLDQVDMAVGHQLPDAVEYVLLGEHIGDIVVDRHPAAAHAQVHVQADPLRGQALVPGR